MSVVQDGCAWQPAPNEHPVLEGIGFTGASFVHLRGFEITGADRRVTIERGSSDLDIDGNDIHDIQTGFLHLRTGGDRITIRNNTVRRTVWIDTNDKDGYGLAMLSGRLAQSDHRKQLLRTYQRRRSSLAVCMDCS